MAIKRKATEKIKRLRKKRSIKNPPLPLLSKRKKIIMNNNKWVQILLMRMHQKKVFNYIQLGENFANLFLAIVFAKGLITDILQSVSLTLYMVHSSQRRQTWSRSKQGLSKRQKLNVYYTCPKIK